MAEQQIQRVESGSPPAAAPGTSLHYSQAPIDEAVIDLHVKFETEPTMAELKAFASAQWKSGFPVAHVINNVAIALQANNAEEVAASSAVSTPQGFRLASPTNDRVIQIRRGGFSFSHLRPYTEWETVRGEMRSRWSTFAEVFPPVSITRLAIRTINRISIPQHTDLARYVTLTPQVVSLAHNPIVGFFMQLILAQPDISPTAKVIINTGIEGGASPDQMNVLLDVDLFREDPFDPNTSAVWDALEQMRVRKNEIFEASITDEVRKLIS